MTTRLGVGGGTSIASSKLDADNYLPSYQQASAGTADMEDDDSGLPFGTGVLNFGSSGQDAVLHRSIEEDEGVSMAEPRGWQQAWSFESITGNMHARGPLDGADDMSETEVNSIGPDIRDAEEKMNVDGPEHSYVEPEAPSADFPGYEEPPEPGLADQANMDDISRQVWANKDLLHQVPVDVGDDEDSDRAVVDIHLAEEP
jgi:hypothetical protein